MSKSYLCVQKYCRLSEKWRLLINIIVFGVAFMVHFAAYHGALNLQSSINAEAGLGNASVAAIHAGFIFANIFLTSVIIKWLGTKWAICVSFAAYMPYIVVQLWPTFYTMIPAGILLGLGAAPLWCAGCVYLSVVSEAYSKLCNLSSEVLTLRFFGLFYAIVQSNQVWGNLISSLVLRSGENEAAVTSVNASQIPEVCGANFLPIAEAGKALVHQPPDKIQMLVGIYLACMAGAVLIVAFGTDSMKRLESVRQTSSLSGSALLTVTMKLLYEPNQLLLIIITIFAGYQFAFFTADINAAYVSCSIGTGTVGFIMMAHGLADVITCSFTAYIVKITGRIPIMVCAGVVHVAMLVALLLWKPQAHSEHLLFILAIFWGSCNSVWLVQINAYNGILFPGREEAGYSNFRMWDSMGAIIANITSSYFRTRTKTYFQLAILLVGLTGYFIIEWRERERKRKEEIEKCEKGCENSGFTIAE